LTHRGITTTFAMLIKPMSQLRFSKSLFLALHPNLRFLEASDYIGPKTICGFRPDVFM